MTEILGRDKFAPYGPCWADARYWRDGLRYEIVLQIMFYTDASKGRGSGPYFSLGHVWTEGEAAKRVVEVNGRLRRSESEIAEIAAQACRATA